MTLRARFEADISSAASPRERRVLVLLWAGILRGAERHVFDLVTALPRHGYSPSVCFFATADAYAPLLANAGVPVVELRNRNTKLSVRGMFRFVRLVRGGRFDLVHDHGAPLWARVVTALASPRTPYVYTEHVTKFTYLRRAVYRIVQRYTTATIAVSSAARSALVDQLGVDPEAVTVIPNAVDPMRFVNSAPPERASVRAELGVEPESMILISVGRLTASKQFDRLIEWLSPTLIRRKDLHLVIVGEGEDYDALCAQSVAASVASQVHLVGRRLDVPRWLAAADMFVFASREESFGIVVAEAMLAGKPVVAVSLPAIEEVVENGVTGYLSDADVADREFGSIVEALAEDVGRRERLGAAGRERALRQFHPDQMVARVVGVYARAIGSGSQP